MKKLGIIMVLLVTLITTGCGSTSKDSEGTQTVKVGVIAPLSGPAATIGEDQAKIFEDAVQKFNASQEEYTVELVVEDGKCSAKDAVSAYQKLTSVDGVQIILGGQCSSETIAAGEIADTQDVVMLSALSSSPDVTPLKNVFRFWNDLDASKAMVDYFAANKKEKIAIIYENTDYAAAFVKALKNQFKGEVLLEEKFNPEEKDFGIIAKNVEKVLDDADMVVVIPQNDTTFISLMKGFKSIGIIDQIKTKIIGADTVYADSVVEQLGKDLDGIYAVQFPNLGETNPLSKSFAEEFQDKYKYTIQWPGFFPFTKESVEVILDAIKDGNTTAADVRAYLEGITAKNQRNGYIGKYYFDENGDGQGLQFVVNQVVEGKLVPLK